MVFYSGSTVKLECRFFDFEGNPINPQLVKLTIYNLKYEVLDTVMVPNGGEVGYYSHFYNFGERNGRFYYEFSGEIDGNPFIKRDLIVTQFV